MICILSRQFELKVCTLSYLRCKAFPAHNLYLLIQLLLNELGEVNAPVFYELLMTR